MTPSNPSSLPPTPAETVAGKDAGFDVKLTRPNILTSASANPIAVVAESIVLPLVACVIGFTVDPADPLGIHAGFPWVWFAPVLLALRYGVLSALGGAGIVLAAWFWLYGGGPEHFPKWTFLGGLILIMLVGEFSSVWLARTRRAETVQFYLEQRLENLTRQYYLLRLSHDRLEQDLISQPMSMRDALRVLHNVPENAHLDPAGSETLMRVLAQYCQLETASLHDIDEQGQAKADPVACIGLNTPLAAADPLVKQALETGLLTHIGQATPEQRRQTRYLIAAPLANLHNTLFGLMVVEKMPFFSLQDETLQTINLLLGYYSDGLSMHALAAGIRSRHPECPLNFAFELQRLWHLQQATNLSSVVVALEILPRAIEMDIPQQLQRLKRALDENWQMQGKGRRLLATLMPIGTRAAAEGYIARIEEWARQREGQTLPQLGIFPHVLVLGEDGPPEQVVERLEQLAHA